MGKAADERCCGAAVAVDRGVCPAGAAGSQPDVARAEARDRNDEQQGDPDRFAAEPREAARSRNGQNGEEQEIVSGKEAPSGNDAGNPEAAPGGPLEWRGSLLLGAPADEKPDGGDDGGDMKTGPAQSSDDAVAEGIFAQRRGGVQTAPAPDFIPVGGPCVRGCQPNSRGAVDSEEAGGHP